MSNEKVKSRSKSYTATADGHDDFDFDITQADFSKFIREVQRDMLMASTNLLLDTCADSERLRKAFEEDWALPLQLIAPIQEELVQTRNVTVKKRKPSLPN